MSQDHSVLKNGFLDNVLVCQALKTLISEVHGIVALCAHESNGNPCSPDLLVELIRSGSGEIVKRARTDEDGFWATIYRHRGRPALYTVAIYEPGCGTIRQEIELQGNGWANVDFDASTCTSIREYGKGRNKK